MKQIYLSKQTQLRKYLSRIQKKIKQNTFYLLSKRRQHQLIRKIQKLQSQLDKRLPEFKFSKIAMTTTMVLGLFAGSNLSAQANFGPLQVTPYNITIQSNSEYISIAFGDIDNDGDMDMFLGNYDGGSSVLFYENIGNPTSPDFALPTITTTDVNSPLPFPNLVDIDNDGDLDLLCGGELLSMSSYYGTSSAYFENIGSNTVFTLGPKQIDPFNLSPMTGYFATHHPVDIDGDGDFDLCSPNIGSNISTLSFSENIGSISSPNFTTFYVDTFGLAATDSVGIPFFADIDGDGDQDCFLGEYYGVISFYENIGSSTAPNFDTIQTNPFQLATIPAEVAIPVFVDIDNDGDLDFFAGGDSTIYFQENLEINNPVAVQTINEEKIDFKLYPNPVNDVLNVQLQKNTSAAIRVRNLYGQLIDEQIITNAQRVDFSIHNLPKGVYVLEIQSEDGSSSKRFVKQ